MHAITRAVLNHRPIILAGKQIKDWAVETGVRWHFPELKDTRYYKVFYLPQKIGRDGKPCPSEPQVRRVHDADITKDVLSHAPVLLTGALIKSWVEKHEGQFREARLLSLRCENLKNTRVYEVIVNPDGIGYEFQDSFAYHLAQARAF